MTIKGNMATYPVGGGIVWDSDPLEEWQEAQHKSRIIDMFQNNIPIGESQLKSYSKI